MRLVTFAASGAARLGALVDGDRRIVDLVAARSDAGPAFASKDAMITAMNDPRYLRGDTAYIKEVTEKVKNSTF